MNDREPIIIFLPEKNSKCVCDVVLVKNEKVQYYEIKMCVYHKCVRDRNPEKVKELLIEFINKLG